MKDNRRLAFILLSLAVIVAGCTDTEDEEPGGEGLEITQFEAQPSSTFEGQSTNIILQATNRGEVDAENVVARLYNIPVGDSESGSWDLQGQDRTQDAPGGVVRAGDDDLPAEEVEIMWSAVAPEIGIQDRDYNAQVRLFYTYQTEASSSIELIERSELQRDDETFARPETSNTDAPIQLEVRTRSPIQYEVESDRELDPNDRLCVIARNTGDGVPLHPDAYNEDANSYDTSSDDRNKIRLEVEDRSRVDFEGDNTGENYEDIPITGTSGQVCFNMDLPHADSFSIREEIPVVLTADYGYYSDTSSVLQVESN